MSRKVGTMSNKKDMYVIWAATATTMKGASSKRHAWSTITATEWETTRFRGKLYLRMHNARYPPSIRYIAILNEALPRPRIKGQHVHLHQMIETTMYPMDTRAISPISASSKPFHASNRDTFPFLLLPQKHRWTENTRQQKMCIFHRNIKSPTRCCKRLLFWIRKSKGKFLCKGRESIFYPVINP